ncbi:hypothetical protein FYJ66_04055 [Clostridiales Family XIII bacterium RF-744-FAT-WT-3]|uniref:X-X-X-Leu-X-X-Gly heptad repeats n=1 Tax=Baileyella intestinalis TaxID=2606709 RepID=A0A6A8M7H5_9FIRM|nr:hypothetical protein [Baileyella intestinalis]MST68763.1 hypothetical protein [Baileyella intestinalis]
MKRKIERKGADRKISVAGKIGATTLAVAMIATSFVGAAGAGTYAASKNDKSSSQAANTGSYSDVFSPNSTSQKDKSETVYAVLDAEGNKEKVVVNEWLTNKNGAKEISDTSDLKDIKNTSGNQKFTKDGDKVTWKADGSDIHYQGTTGKQLPVDVAVSYYLNGEQVSAKDIAGKSGDVEIHFDYKVNRSELADGSSVTKPYTMASAVMLDNSHFTNVTVDNGKVVNDGNTSMCIGIAFPGLAGNLGLGATGVSIPDSVVIKAHTDKFQIDGTYTAAMSGVMSDIDTSATGNVESKVSQLESGLDQLVSASDKLMSGTDQLKAGIDQLNAGAGTLKNGTQELALGADQLDKSVKASGNDLSSQIQVLTPDQINAYGAQAQAVAEADKDEKIDAGAQQVTDGIMNSAVKETAYQSAYNSVVGVLVQNAGATSIGQLPADAQKKITTAANDAATEAAKEASENTTVSGGIKAGVKTAMTQTAGAAANKATVTTATTFNEKTKVAAQKLNASMSALSQGTGKLNAGASKLNSGAGDLYTGTNKLTAGAATLDSGMAQFNKEGIHKMADTLNGSQLLTIGKRIKAAADADRIEYLIGGKSAGMSGESKIIYKTAEVK